MGRNKKNRKPFANTKVGGFLFKTTVGGILLDTVQGWVPGVGTIVTKARKNAEIVAKVEATAEGFLRDELAKEISNKFTRSEKIRILGGLYVLNLALKGLFPAYAETIDGIVKELVGLIAF